MSSVGYTLPIIITILLMVCTVMARVIQVLWRKLEEERSWISDPRHFPFMVENMCFRAVGGDKQEMLRAECLKALDLLNNR